MKRSIKKTAFVGAITACLALSGLAFYSSAQNAVTDLTVWLPAGSPEAGPPPADWEVYKIIRDKLNINLKLVVAPIGAEGETKLGALAAANDLPDLFEMRNRNQFFQLAGQGLLGNVKPIVKFMPQRNLERYKNADLNLLATVGGTMFGLQEAQLLYKRTSLLIRQDWLDKLGLKPPTTLVEFMNVAKAFTEKDPDGNGKNDTYGLGINSDWTPGGFDIVYGAYGVVGNWNLGSAANFKLNAREANYRKATEFVNGLIDAKVVDPDWPTLKTSDFRNRWKQGKYGIFAEDFCAAMCSFNYAPFDTSNPTGVLKTLLPPVGPDGKSSSGTFAAAGTLLTASKKAIDAGKGQAIARFLEWANAGEGYFLLAFGKRGLNYNLDRNGIVTAAGIEPANLYNTASFAKFTQMRNIALNGRPRELAARYPIFKTINGRTIAPMDTYRTSFATPHTNIISTFLIKPASNQADLDRYINENRIQFQLGQKPINDSTWDQFVGGLNNLRANEYEATAKQTLLAAGFLK